MLLFTLFLLLAVFCLSAGYFALRNARQKTAVERMTEWLGDQPAERKAVKKKRSRDKLTRPVEGSSILHGVLEKKRRRLLQADWSLTPEEWLGMKVLLRLGIPLVLLWYAGVMGMLLSLPIAWLLPDLYLNIKRRSRQKEFEDQLGDAISILSNALKAGYSFLQAVSSVAREMPDPISKEFRRVLKELSLGMSTEKAMQNLTDRVDSEDLSLMVTAILIQRETGGNLSEILDNIAETIRERIKLQGEIRSLTAQGKMTGMIVGAMPLFLMAFLYVSDPDYIMLLFTHPAGRTMVAMAVINEVLGILMIKKIIRVEV